MQLRSCAVLLGLTLLGTAVLSCGRTEVNPRDRALGISDGFVRFSAQPGDPVSALRIELTQNSGTPLHWLASVDAPWLSVSPASGSGPSELLVSVNTTDVAPGVHTGEIRFNVVEGTGSISPDHITVELNIQAEQWIELDGPYGGRITAIAVDPADATRVFAGNSSGGLYISIDSGVSFAPTTSSFAGRAITAITFGDGDRAYMTTDGDGVHRSDDAGRTWAPTTLQNIPLSTVAVDPSLPDRVLVAGSSCYRSTDGGSTWSAVASPAAIDRVFFDSVEGSFFASDGGTLYSGDGLTFSAAAGSLPVSITGVAVLPSGRWVVSRRTTYDDRIGLEVSDDRGATWRLAGIGLTTDYSSQDTLQVLWTAGQLWARTSWGIYSSDDEGETFLEVALPFQSNGRELHTLTAHPEALLLGHESEGVLRLAADRTVTTARLFAHSVRTVQYHAGSGLIFGLSSVGGAFSASLGGTFDIFGAPGATDESIRCLDVDPRSTNFRYLLSDGYYGGLFRSTNGGVSWNELTVGLPGRWHGWMARTPSDPDVLWATGHDSSSGLYRSTDNGDSWTEVAPEGAYQIAPVSRDVALYDGAGVERIDVTAGSTTSITGSSAGFVRTLRDGSVWYSNSNGLMRSTDGGLSFDNLGYIGDTALALAVDPQDPNRIFVSYDTGVFYSQDGGTTWESIPTPFTVTAMDITPSGTEVIAGTRYGGLYLLVP